jgi:hypothetical protein
MAKVAPVQRRKGEHLRINLQQDVASAQRTGLEKLRFAHEALPEIALGAVDPSLELFGRRLKAPLLISSMTGGTEEAGAINRRWLRRQRRQDRTAWALKGPPWRTRPAPVPDPPFAPECFYSPTWGRAIEYGVPDECAGPSTWSRLTP